MYPTFICFAFVFQYSNPDLYVAKKNSMSNQQVYPFGYTISVCPYVVLKLIRIEYKNKQLIAQSTSSSTKHGLRWIDRAQKGRELCTAVCIA